MIKALENQLQRGGELEKAWLAVVHHYEELLFQLHGRHVRAIYTWKKLARRHGDVRQFLIDTMGNPIIGRGFAMVEPEHTFEHLVVRHAQAFTEATVAEANARLGGVVA